MNRLPLLSSFLLLLLLLFGNPLAPGAAMVAGECGPSDDSIGFLCGPVSPEDLVPVPRSPWVIVSSMEAEGHLYAVHTGTDEIVTLFPAGSAAARLDAAIFGSCPGPVAGAFQPHGLSLRPGDGDRHELYVVRHGDRESIEAFEIDVSSETPTVNWIGCAVAPDGVTFNSVASLPGGGFAATHFRFPEGEVWEWSPDDGWSEVPESKVAAPNGLEASADGRWLYVGGWGSQSMIRLSRGQSPVERHEVEVGFHVDNMRFSPDGSLLAAGHTGADIAAIGTCLGGGSCDGIESRVAEIDLDSMSATELLRYPSDENVILGTIALKIGDEIWLGQVGGGDRIARFSTHR